MASRRVWGIVFAMTSLTFGTGAAAVQAQDASMLRAQGQAKYECEDADMTLNFALRDAIGQLFERSQDFNPGMEREWTRRLILGAPRYTVPSQFYDFHGRGVTVNIPRERFLARVAEARRFVNDFLGGDSPTVALFAVDRIEENNNIYCGRVTENNKDSWFIQQISESLTHAGFRVVIHDQAELQKKARVAFAMDSALLQAAKALAAEDSAQMYIVASAHVIGPKRDNQMRPGATDYIWTANGKAMVFWTDNAVQIANKSQAAPASDEDSSQGRIAALRKAGRLMAPKLLDDIFESWARLAFDGRSLELRVLHCDAGQAMEIKKALEKIVGRLPRGFPSHGAWKTEIHRCRLAADELGETLSKSQFSSFKSLKVRQATFHTLEMEVNN